MRARVASAMLFALPAAAEEALTDLTTLPIDPGRFEGGDLQGSAGRILGLWDCRTCADPVFVLLNLDPAPPWLAAGVSINDPAERDRVRTGYCDPAWPVCEVSVDNLSDGRPALALHVVMPDPQLQVEERRIPVGTSELRITAGAVDRDLALRNLDAALDMILPQLQAPR
ncbi:MAG: hypothetical protein HLUCCA08_07925 [Rhodobacteraceae bacterium HLUCCA08]|nr:MAG: hypothetical protein HLUCCA08_07925 [Rhodobacteraceae bacterium HLUCCA08]